MAVLPPASNYIVFSCLANSCEKDNKAVGSNATDIHWSSPTSPQHPRHSWLWDIWGRWATIWRVLLHLELEWHHHPLLWLKLLLPYYLWLLSLHISSLCSIFTCYPLISGSCISTHLKLILSPFTYSFYLFIHSFTFTYNLPTTITDLSRLAFSRHSLDPLGHRRISISKQPKFNNPAKCKCLLLMHTVYSYCNYLPMLSACHPTIINWAPSPISPK